MISQLQKNEELIKIGVQSVLNYTQAILNHTEYVDPLPYIPIEYIQNVNSNTFIDTRYYWR